jgi:hypothetical protein
MVWAVIDVGLNGFGTPDGTYGFDSRFKVARQ